MTKRSSGSERMRLNDVLWKSAVALAIVFAIYTFLEAHLGFSSGPTGGNAAPPWSVRDTLAGRQTQRQPAVNY